MSFRIFDKYFLVMSFLANIFLANLGNNFGIGVVPHHPDPPNLASAGSKTTRDFDQTVLHGVATHRHEINTLGYLDRVHRRQSEMK